MASATSKRVAAQQIEADVDAYSALLGIPTYIPRNPRNSTESAGAALQAMRAADIAVIQIQNTLAQARETLIASEREFHEIMLGVKDEAKVLFGDDSDEIAALGIKRKSDRARPKRTSKAKATVKED